MPSPSSSGSFVSAADCYPSVHLRCISAITNCDRCSRNSRRSVMRARWQRLQRPQPQMQLRLHRLSLPHPPLLAILVITAPRKTITVTVIGTGDMTGIDIPPDMSAFNVSFFSDCFSDLSNSDRRRERERSRSPGRRRY